MSRRKNNIRRAKRQRQRARARRNQAEHVEATILRQGREGDSEGGILLGGHELDKLTQEYLLCRLPGESDAELRARIQLVMINGPT